MFYHSFIIFILLFCNSLVKCSLLSNNSASRQNEDKPPKQKWITEIFDEAKHQFSMVENVTEACRNDFQLYLQHLKNQSIWAVRMLESSEWPSVGVLAGNGVFMGNWFECRLISAYGIKGQFCFANAIYDYDDDEAYDSVEFPPQESSAWNAVKMFDKDPSRLSRSQLKWGICIPASCTSEELKNSLNSQLKPIFQKYQIRIQTDVNPAMCSKQEKYNTTQYRIFKYCASLYIVILVLCTVLDSKNDATKKNTLGKKILESLSLTNNAKSLVRPTSAVQRTAHLTKALTTCLILYAHLNYYLMGYPKYNPEKIELDYKEFSANLGHSALTDLFLMVSGYLAFVFGIKVVSKGGAGALALSWFIRWIRLTVPLGVIIYLTTFVVPYLGDGPLWKYNVWRESEFCRENWWASIFTVANIFNVNRQCLIISWYISVDLHLALASSILLFVMNKNLKVGLICTIAFFVVGMFTTFAVVYVRRLNGVLRFFFSTLEDPRNSDDFNYQYIATYSRVAPYFTGFLMAFVANVLLERNIKPPKFFIRIVFFVSLVLADLYQVYSILFYQYGREYNVLENALYAATHRWIFVAPFAFALLAAATSEIDKIFAALAKTKISLITGRLSFSTFILNTTILLIFFSLQADLMPTSHGINVYWFTAALILVSYIFGFIFYMLVEAPVFNLAKLLSAILFSLGSSNSPRKKSIVPTEGIMSKDKDTKTMNGAVNEGFDSSAENGKIFNISGPKKTLGLVCNSKK